MFVFKDHPWVTKRGTDPLLSAEENTANLIEPPTEKEKNEAITGNLSNILVIVRIFSVEESHELINLTDEGS